MHTIFYMHYLKFQNLDGVIQKCSFGKADGLLMDLLSLVQNTSTHVHGYNTRTWCHGCLVDIDLAKVIAYLFKLTLYT